MTHPKWLEFELGIDLSKADLNDYDLYYNDLLQHRGENFDYLIIEKEGKWILAMDPDVIKRWGREDNLLQLYQYFDRPVPNENLSIREAIESAYYPSKLEVWRKEFKDIPLQDKKDALKTSAPS